VIVDDDRAVCGSLKFLLELKGFGVRACVSAAALLCAGDLAACDCIVIDQRMPGMSGMELIARLRDLKVETPTILLISDPNPAVFVRRARGTDGDIAPPEIISGDECAGLFQDVKKSYFLFRR
jgi:FixJ family two-component response regulator